jgi:putative endopeptidase
MIVLSSNKPAANRGALFAVAAMLLVTTCGAAQAASDQQFGTFGLDLTARDPSIKPGDDFYRYANGHWLQTTHRPSDRSRWGNFDLLEEAAEEQVHGMIENLPRNTPAGGIEQQVGDYYRALMDEAAINAAGVGPVRGSLNVIDAARTYSDIAELMGRPDLHLNVPLLVSIAIDEKNPDRYLVRVSQSGLGLPDRDYYLKQDEKFVTVRAQYRLHLENMLRLAGEADSAGKAQQIFDFETAIASRHWPREKSRDRDLTYNPRSAAQMEQLAPEFPWRAMLTPLGLDRHQQFNIAEPEAVGNLGKLVTAVPIPVLRSYLKVHFLDSVAAALPTPFDQEHFDFYERRLNGQSESGERWKRAVSASNHAMGNAIGHLYVNQYFPPSTKAKILELVRNLQQAYIERLHNAAWMSVETRKVAAEKATMFRLQIGYPDKWIDYSFLVIRPNDALGNQIRAQLFNWQRQLHRVDLPTDRDEWLLNPQTVNAYYDAPFNEVVFPAAILQPPFFDPDSDPAVNYGAIGGVIGHEMGHAFDDQGSKSDARGVLRSWWLPQDSAAFNNLGDRLVGQYDLYEPVPGLHINGRVNLGENMADLAGLSIAYVAYHSSIKGGVPPVLSGLTGDQRFFLSCAQMWRTLISDEKLRNQIMSDAHSPQQFRVDGIVRNVDAWYGAFGIRPGDALYLAPSDRIHIW